jgi:hypothetical protein
MGEWACACRAVAEEDPEERAMMGKEGCAGRGGRACGGGDEYRRRRQGVGGGTGPLAAAPMRPIDACRPASTSLAGGQAGTEERVVEERGHYSRF